jgi:phage baseplate assembly protein W
MPDLSLDFSGDLALSAAGDILAADGSPLGVQRVLRRLLTNPGDYIWQPDYGAGLAQFIGEPAAADAIEAVILNQMTYEAVVSQTPDPPAVTVTVAVDGTVTASVAYVDAVTGEGQTATVPVASNAP